MSWRLGEWWKVTEGATGKKVVSVGIRQEDVVTSFEDVSQRMKTRVVCGD